MRAASSRVFDISSSAGCTAFTRPDGECLLGGDDVARVAELAGLADADAASKALRASEPGNDAELHLGLAEFRLFRGEDEVARQGELATAAEREPIHRGDDGKRCRLEERAEAMPVFGEAQRLGGGHRRHRRDVGTRHERFARAGENRDARRIALGRHQRVHLTKEGRDGGGIERVELLGTRDGERDEVPALLDDDGLAHQTTLPTAIKRWRSLISMSKVRASAWRARPSLVPTP